MITLPKREHLEKTGDRELDSLSRSHYLPVVRTVYRKRIEMVMSLIPNHPPVDALLDIGYGVGMMLPELSKRCKRLYGVDRHDKFSIVKRMLERNHISSQLAVGDILHLGYKKASMDCIVCASVLEHVRDLPAAMNEISGVLKEGGALILGFPVKNKITKLLFRFLGFNDEEIHPSSHTEILEEALRHFELEEMQQFPRFVPRYLALYITLRLKKKGKDPSADVLESIQSQRKREVSLFFDKIAGRYDFWHSKNKYYYQEIARFCSQLIPQGSRVLEIGCATGDLLHHVAPETGTGIDLSPRMVEQASQKYPRLRWLATDIEHLEPKEPYDHILMVNLLEFMPDLWSFLNEVKKCTHSQTRLVILTVNPLWEPLMRWGARWGLRTSEMMRNFITRRDLVNLLDLLGYEMTSSGFRLFFPKGIPFFSFWINQILPRIPVVNNLCALQFIVVKPESTNRKRLDVSCSVIVPCFNEAENIEECIQRIPRMGEMTEVLVVDDGSTDSTAEKAKRATDPAKEIKVISYRPNKGKFSAVCAGIEAARGDIVMILDADMAVLPEELPRFFKILAEGRAEFVNGTRMVYSLESDAMKFLNFLGNKLFGILLTFIMEQRNTDTLCGTKAFFKKDFTPFINRGSDAWGDFNLLFEAARKRLKMAELPVHYYPRKKGFSKMRPFRDGVLFLRTCIKGLRSIH